MKKYDWYDAFIIKGQVDKEWDTYDITLDTEEIMYSIDDDEENNVLTFTKEDIIHMASEMGLKVTEK